MTDDIHETAGAAAAADGEAVAGETVTAAGGEAVAGGETVGGLCRARRQRRCRGLEDPRDCPSE